MKHLSLIFILIITLQSCKSQRSEKTNAHILKISKLAGLNNRSSNIVIDLKKRLPFISSDELKKIKNSISEETMENDILNTFYSKFTSLEIELLLNYMKESYKKNHRNILLEQKENNIKTNISEDLSERNGKVIERLYKKDEERYNQFKKEFFRLEKISYKNGKDKGILDTLKSISRNQKIKRTNGIYEVIKGQNKNYNDSLRLVKEPYLDFKYNYVKSVNEQATEYSGFYYNIEIILNPPGAKRFYKLTKKNVDKQLAIVVNNEIISAPTVGQPIEGGKILISGNFTFYEVKNIVSKIKSSYE